MATPINLNTKDPVYMFGQLLEAIVPVLQQAADAASIHKISEAREIVGKLSAARMICERLVNPGRPAGQIRFHNPATADVPSIPQGGDE